MALFFITITELSIKSNLNQLSNKEHNFLKNIAFKKQIEYQLITDEYNNAFAVFCDNVLILKSNTNAVFNNIIIEIYNNTKENNNDFIEDLKEKYPNIKIKKSYII